jgi:hypothetical protein
MREIFSENRGLTLSVRLYGLLLAAYPAEGAGVRAAHSCESGWRRFWTWRGLRRASICETAGEECN